jgi:uncharacterized membrane protein YfcA
MALSTLALLATAAFLAGVVDAIAGGGGLLTVPALLLTGLPTAQVLGTNKGQSVFGSGTALWRFWRAGRIDPTRIGPAFGLGFCGSLCGALAVGLIPDAVLKPLILGLLLAVAIFLAIRRDFGSTPGTLGFSPVRAAVLAFTIGAYDGFFGPGTGTFLIMAQVAWLGDGMTGASAHAKIVNFASNLAAMLLFAYKGSVLWPVALPMAGAQMLGSVVGVRLAVRGGDRFVRSVVLAVVVALVAKVGHGYRINEPADAVPSRDVPSVAEYEPPGPCDHLPRGVM